MRRVSEWAALVLAAPLLLGADEKTDLNGFDVDGATVPRRAIVAGGPGRDGIRSVDAPEFAPAGEASWVAAETPVLGVEAGSEARIYPVHLLEYHQIVNDVLGGVPVAITYDPLSAAPLAFRRTVAGRTLSFGVSGLLYNSNFLMYDRETESLWSQFTGAAIAGPLAGKTLERIRVRQETTAARLAAHPGSGVLTRPDRFRIDYGYSPFSAYMIADTIPFPVNAEDRRYHAKELVVGARVNGKTRAYLGSLVTKAGGSIEDEFEGRAIRVRYDPEAAVFTWDAPDDVEITEAYWFAWKAFHPETRIWSDSKPRAE
jgi:hypothetical protein